MSTSLSLSLSGPNLSLKGKGRVRGTNGKEKSNGSIRRDSRSRDPKGRWSYDFPPGGSVGANSAEENWSSCTWSDERAAFAPTSAPIPNVVPEERLPPLDNRSDSFVSHMVVPRDGGPDVGLPSHNHHPTSAFLTANESWPGQYTGPASGFLHPRGSFDRVSPNPGRTIYSHHHQAGSFR